MNDETLRVVRDAAAAAFRDTPVFLAYAYGSRASGTPRADSDLDIGYYLSRSYERHDLPLYDQMLIEARLSGAIGLSVDLRNLADAPLELRGKALEEGVRVYCSDQKARVAIETALLSRYHDYKPTLAASHEQRLAALAAAGSLPHG